MDDDNVNDAIGGLTDDEEGIAVAVRKARQLERKAQSPLHLMERFWEDFGSFSALLRSFVAAEFCPNFSPSLPKFQISLCSAVGALPRLDGRQLKGRRCAERVKCQMLLFTPL